jgi:hypothetical protein
MSTLLRHIASARQVWRREIVRRNNFLLSPHAHVSVTSPTSPSEPDVRGVAFQSQLIHLETHSSQRTMSSESPAVLAAKAALASIDLSNYDPEQSKLMDERCILVDEQDNAIGAMDKKTCKVPSAHVLLRHR